MSISAPSTGDPGRSHAAALPEVENPTKGWPSTIFVVTTKKGGAGKTETSECLEAISALSGKKCAIIDVDDGNRGMARRIGATNVTQVSWDIAVTEAPAWSERHAQGNDTLIFDLGAGIDSSDLPVMAFLSSVWRYLVNRGARLVVCAVVSTNAPTSNYIGRLSDRFDGLGEVVVVCNNQDGSASFPAEIASLAQPKVQLEQLPSGIQAARLQIKDRLSAVITAPPQEYSLAGAVMARRLREFARQAFFGSFGFAPAIDFLEQRSQKAPRQLKYVIGRLGLASDELITLNANLGHAHAALVRDGMTNSDIVAAAETYRTEFHKFSNAARLV